MLHPAGTGDTVLVDGVLTADVKSNTTATTRIEGAFPSFLPSISLQPKMLAERMRQMPSPGMPGTATFPKDDRS